MMDMIDIQPYKKMIVSLCTHILNTFATDSLMHLYLTCAEAFYHGLFCKELDSHYHQEKNLGKKGLPDLRELVFSLFYLFYCWI